MTTQVDNDSLSKGIGEFYVDARSRYPELAEQWDASESATRARVTAWLTNEAVAALSSGFRPGLQRAIEAGRFDEIVNAFSREVAFGTGGIRALMASTATEIRRLKECGIHADVVMGTGTFNAVVVSQMAAGVASFLNSPGAQSMLGMAGVPQVVVGFDSRVCGQDFAARVAEVLLAARVRVLLFDEAVPYPEVTFAIPHLGADLGVFISASHNDLRYNGFKVSGPSGAQLTPDIRDALLYGHIRTTKFEDVVLSSMPRLVQENADALVYLGGAEPQSEYSYLSVSAAIVDIHAAHRRHIESMLSSPLRPGEYVRGARNLRVAYAAFNGAGRRAVPRLLSDLGFSQTESIRSLDPLDGLFPAFESTPGKEQQPDPGDPRACGIALRELEMQRDASLSALGSWSATDILIGTDPDADRCSITMHQPGMVGARDEHALRSHGIAGPDALMLSADEMWAALIAFRARQLPHHVADEWRRSGFVALSHTTSDLITRIAQHEGLGVLKTWVGFGWIANGVAQAWNGVLPLGVRDGHPSPESVQCDLVVCDSSLMTRSRTLNVACCEQSNGFSLLGSRPDNPIRQLGRAGHVRDKDGTLAAILMAELFASIRANGSDLWVGLEELLTPAYSRGMIVNVYRADPEDGEYPGVEGDARKARLLKAAVSLAAESGLHFRGLRVTRSLVYRTGKYDAANWDGFPDEGVRFYLDNDESFVTVRPSGTTNSLRVHVQLAIPRDAGQSIWEARVFATTLATAILDEVAAAIGVES